MNLRKCLLLVLTIALAAAADTPARTRTRPKERRYTQVRQTRPPQIAPPRPALNNSSKVELDLDYRFTTPQQTSKIKFVVMLPKSIPGKQKILGISYSQKPARVFTENGNRYAEFVFAKPRKSFKVSITVKAELFRYDLATARKKRQDTPAQADQLEGFLAHERYIEKDDIEIQRIADNITGRSETETVKKIYEYVTDSMEYIIRSGSNLGAARAAQEKKGDCSEYSDLFVALCRAKKIPARVATGYTVRFDGNPPKHHWAEVYLAKHGWVPFDPSWGDLQDSRMRNRAFDKMKPVYIYLTHVRNVPTLFNKHFYSYAYWGAKAAMTDSIKFTQLPQDDVKSR
jgi:transglutaminase-like putative cysteine protease